MSAASRNDAAPILGVLLERISLEWIDLVAYEAHDRHWYPLHGRSGRGIAASGQRRDRCQDAADGFAAADRHGCGLGWLHAQQHASCLTRTLRLLSKYECRR